MSVWSLLTAGCAALLFAFSAVQLGLSGYVLYYIYQPRSTPYWVWININNIIYRIYWLPYVNVDRSYILQVTTGALGVIIGTVVFFLAIHAKPYSFTITGKRGARRISWPGISALMGLLLWCFSFSTLIVSFSDNTRYGVASIPSITTLFTSTSSTQGGEAYSDSRLALPITVEGWVCRGNPSLFSPYLLRSASNNAAEIFPRTCQISYLARWFTIPLMILPIFIGGVAFFEYRRKNMSQYQTQKETSLGVGLYPKEQSFSSHADTINSPVSPITAPGTLPGYSARSSEMGGGQRVDAEAGGKQVMEAPEKLPYDEMPAMEHQVYSELSGGKSREAVARE